MVSIWGTTKKDDDHEAAASQNGESSEHNAQPRTSEADERTRLLPPQPRELYLSPDDPAVCHRFAFLETLRQYLEVKLISSLGFSLQSLECALAEILYRLFCHNKLPMVGAAVGIDIR